MVTLIECHAFVSTLMKEECLKLQSNHSITQVDLLRKKYRKINPNWPHDT